MPSNGFRRSKRLIAATTVLAISGGTAAVAFVGGEGNGKPPTSAAPDMLSVQIQTTVAPTSPLGPEARFCFDEVINPASIGGTLFRLSTYDTDRRVASVSASIDTADPTCVIATFGNGEDIGQMTVGYTAAAGSVANNAGITAPQETAPVTGTEVVRSAGSTTAPDLTGAIPNSAASPPRIQYTFDENLDPALAGGGAALANKFGFYVDTDNGSAPRRGSTIIGVDGKTIVIGFTVADAVQQSKYYFVDPLGAGDSPRDRIVNAALPNPSLTTNSPIGAAGPAITGGPTLVSAAKQANNQIVNMTFAQNVIPGSVGAAAPGGNVVAYRADASPIAGTYVIGTSGADLKTLPVTLPSTVQNDPGSVVRLGIRPGLVRNQANDRDNSIGVAAIGDEPFAAGYSDGPDLLRASVNDTTNTVTYVYDEPLRTTPNPNGNEFQVINSDGSVTAGQAGSAVVSGDRLSVDVKFSGSVSGSSTAGVSNIFFATQDDVNDNPAAGNGALPGSVSLTLFECVELGTCPQPTPTATTSPTASPTATPTQGPTIQRRTIKSKVKGLKRKKNGRKYKGKIKAGGPCKSGRQVRLFKGNKRVKSVTTKGNGKFVFNLKKKQAIKKGKARIKITKRIVINGNVRTKCTSTKKKA